MADETKEEENNEKKKEKGKVTRDPVVEIS